MITSIRLQDFKGHRDTTVPLGRFTVLIWPNGSGKTSVLEALWLQSQLAERRIEQVLQGDWSVSDLRRHGAAQPIVLTSDGLSITFGITDHAPLTLNWNKSEWRVPIDNSIANIS